MGDAWDALPACTGCTAQLPQLPALGRWDPAALFTTQLGGLASVATVLDPQLLVDRSILIGTVLSLARHEANLSLARLAHALGLLHAFRSLQYQY